MMDVTVNTKEQKSRDFRPNYVQEYTLWTITVLHKSVKQSGHIHKESGSGKIVGSFFYMLSGNKFKPSAVARAVCV
jgi:hypothetical protein